MFTSALEDYADCTSVHIPVARRNLEDLKKAKLLAETQLLAQRNAAPSAAN